MRVLLIVRLLEASILNIISKVTLCGDELMMTLEDDLLLHYLMAFFQIQLCVAVCL
jgi:hypothetical protein